VAWYFETAHVKTISLFPLVFLSAFASAQNLVPNPSFEENPANLPSYARNYIYRRERPVVKGWYQATPGSIDYYNSDRSSIHGAYLHYAHSGQGRVGMVLELNPQPWIDRGYYEPDYKEYIQARLLQPLKENVRYSVSFYLVLDKRSEYAARSVGAYFSADSLLGNVRNDRDSLRQNGTPLHYEAQVATTNDSLLWSTRQWVRVQGYYTAKGGERFITIGSFGKDAPQLLPKSPLYDYGLFRYCAYYYVDDVSVEEAETENNSNRPAGPAYNNLVLVLDVSESMHEQGKLDALKKGVDSLLSALGPEEEISVITFDASPKVLAENCGYNQRKTVLARIDSLKPGGGTNVTASLKKAYELIDETYLPEKNNSVILITDAGYQVSDHSRQLIVDHYKEKDVHFSTLVFSDRKTRDVKRICNKTGGNYKNVDKDNLTIALNKQVVRPRRIKDSNEDHANSYSGIITLDTSLTGMGPDPARRQRAAYQLLLVGLLVLGAALSGVK
jgi:Mg-chelatase subunit ChlD